MKAYSAMQYNCSVSVEKPLIVGGLHCRQKMVIRKDGAHNYNEVLIPCLSIQAEIDEVTCGDKLCTGIALVPDLALFLSKYMPDKMVNVKQDHPIKVIFGDPSALGRFGMQTMKGTLVLKRVSRELTINHFVCYQIGEPIENKIAYAFKTPMVSFSNTEAVSTGVFIPNCARVIYNKIYLKDKNSYHVIFEAYDTADEDIPTDLWDCSYENFTNGIADLSLMVRTEKKKKVACLKESRVQSDDDDEEDELKLSDEDND